MAEIVAMSTASERLALAELLQRARGAAGGRRSLTVDEAAERAGVGPIWYRSLEEGRNVGLSSASLGWVAAALGIEGAARKRLFDLAGVAETAELVPFAEPVPALLQQIIDELSPLPAYLVGRRADVLAWNDAAEAVYRCHLIPQRRRNSYLFMFTSPEIQKLFVNWKELARGYAQALRSKIQKEPHDPLLADLRRFLEAESPDFRAFWSSKARSVDSGAVVFAHPRAGRLVFEKRSLACDEERKLLIRTYVPTLRDGTRERLEKLVRLHRRNESKVERRTTQAAVRRVKEHLEACYAREVLLDELAALVGMNKYLLLRAFANEVGYPPHAYQLLLRIFHARQLLSRGQSLADVAAAVGFTDQSHLSRHFKRIEGITPAEYARRPHRATTL